MSEKPSTRILVVEDDPAITFGLRTNLTFEGYDVEIVETRAGGISAVRKRPPDLVVLDLMLPDGSGFDVMEELQRDGYGGRILVLSARMAETDKVTALRMGADDYVTKPFSLAELLARIAAILRRSTAGRPPGNGNGGLSHGDGTRAAEPTPSGGSSEAGGATRLAADRVRFSDCEVDIPSRTLRVAGEEVALTRLEFDLLLYFAKNTGRVLTRSELLRDVWGLPHDGSARTVDNVIAHLRTKIGEDAEKPRHLLTQRGAGYRFELHPVERNGKK